jgi:hypothetical protein
MKRGRSAPSFEKAWLLVKTIRRQDESPIKFQKRSQFLIRTHNETLSVVAMRVGNPDRSPVRINH